MTREFEQIRGWLTDSRQPRAWKRILAFASILGTLAAIVCFARLSEGSLASDEAAFACTTERMKATGDWIVPHIVDEPHLNATPLYNWLTLAASPWLDETPLRYRFWSAAFGVGCVLMTFLLGTLMFRLEVGFLAGLFLTFNRDLLFYHGFRFGGMESMLTFFITAGICCYAWLKNRAGRNWLGWSLMGVCMGFAWLSKPPVFASFFMTLVLIHHFWTSRGEARTTRFAGPALMLAVGLLVAGPWYVLLCSRLGSSSLHSLFVYNSVGRALDSTIRDFGGCHRGIQRASTSFKLVDGAAIAALFCCLLRHRRPQWGLLLLLTSVYVLALSATGKAGSHLWYTFYAFPLLAVMLAGFFLDAGPRLLQTIGMRFQAACIAGACLAAAFISVDLIKIGLAIDKPSWLFPPIALYDRYSAQLEQGQCRFILFDFPHASGISATGRSGANYEDLYYGPKMRGALRIDQVEDLQRLLSEPTPTVVLLPSLQWPTSQSVDRLRPELVVQSNPIHSYTYPLLSFHGASAKVSVAELIKLSRSNQP